MSELRREDTALDAEVGGQWDDGAVANAAMERAVADIVELLQRQVGFDFSVYKSTALVRRIERQMALRQILAVGDFVAFLLAHPGEVEMLAMDLLIGVTEFFRDSEVFQYLEATVLPEFLGGRMPQGELRIWSAACASGEEAYSLAMLALEVAEQVGFTGGIKVFATDAQQKVLDQAVRGRYSAEALSRVPAARLRRWFVSDGDGSWRVTAELRRCVVFARHNLLIDPPFTRIDLVLCRNLLIYLRPEAQLMALSQLHFALQSEGLLLLGSSEGVGRLEGMFEVVERAHRLYRKGNTGCHRPLPFPMPGPVQLLQVGEGRAVIDRRLLRDYDVLLRRYMPPGMLVDEDHRVLHWFGDLTPFLRMPEGRAEADVLALVSDPLRPALGIVLHRAAETRTRALAESVPMVLNGVDSRVNVSADCILDDRSRAAHYHISFSVVVGAIPERRQPTGVVGVDLERELRQMRERLHSTIVELQASNARLDLTNEELTASNEELQSTNEELKSVNEDLYQVNAELEEKNVQLGLLNRDYDNLLASTEVGTVFLDSDLNIRKFSPAIGAFLQLLPQDIGRPITHIAYHLGSQTDLLGDIRQVLAEGGRVERELEDGQGRRFLKRILPFRDENGHQDGVVLTYTDVTAVRAAEAERAHLRRILDALPDGVYIVNDRFQIEYVNPVLEQQFGPVAGRNCHDYLHGKASPCPWCRMEQVLRGEAVRWEWVSPQGRTYDLVDLPFENADGSISKLELMHDITERKQAEEALAHNEARLRSMLLAMHDGVILWDTAGRVVLANGAAERILGMPGGSVGARGYADWELCDAEGQALPVAAFPLSRVLVNRMAESGQILGVTRSDGRRCWLQLNAEPIFEQDELVGVVTSFADITRLKEFEARLSRSRDFYLSVLERFPALIWRAGVDGNCDYFNSTWLEFTGRTVDQEKGDGWAEGVHSDDLQRCLDVYRRHFAVRQPFAMEYRLRRHDGQYRWILDLGRPFLDLDGQFAGYLGACFDVSDRHEAEDRLRLAACVFAESGEGIMITDASRRIVEVNRAFTSITGYTLDEVVGQLPRLLSSGRHDTSFYQRLDQCLTEHGYWHGEIWNRRKNGEIYPEWLGISAICDDKGQITHYLGIFSDITERKASEARIEYMAHHDALTGLPNRLLFRERFDLAIAYAQRNGTRAALLFLDLDRFKAINDSLGHLVGDELLRAVARRLRECMRDTDTLSRQGGDEFLVVLGDLRDVGAAGQVVEKILASFSRPFLLNGQELAISLSVGVSVFPDDAEDFDSLLKMADTAMYYAKEAGRNTYRFFDQRMNVNAVERLLIANGLRRALAQNEFVLHFQPQMDIASGRVTGAEALVRWQSPDAGLIMPGRFISVAEESGLIVPLGEWVLNEACRQAVAWQRPGSPAVMVAVNLSAIQFKRGELEQTVMGALVRSGLDPGCLELELTESLLLHDTEHVLAAVRRLKSLGIRLSIDDFGTGYSSLAYLKRFAVDRLKIDQSFIRDLGDDADAASIVRAIIQMARSLNLHTVSEGVEEERQLEYLRAFHCDEAQGYFCARPMPAAEFALWLEAHSAL